MKLFLTGFEEVDGPFIQSLNGSGKDQVECSQLKINSIVSSTTIPLDGWRKKM